MKSNRCALFGTLVLALSAMTTSGFSELRLAPPFTDHAVLQRDVSVPVWGWDEKPGATVIVSFRGQTKETRVNPSGLWRADLDAMPAAVEGTDLVIAGSTTLTLHDVVVGEVWLASGQSNMEWKLSSSRGFAEEKARAANPLIRNLHIDHAGADLPVATVAHTGWQSASPEIMGTFSGVGYFFAEHLSQELKVPVGIIDASWGGTAIESWIPEPVLRSTRAWRNLEPKWIEALKAFPEAYAKQPALEAAWQKAWEDFNAHGTPVTMEWPRPPMGPGSSLAPARLFNGMIAPLAPFALRGALWYQGESNVGRHDEYMELLLAMIGAWRSTWPQGDFPFLVVQLPNYSDNNPTGRAWAQLREAQDQVVRQVPATSLAVIVDGDEPNNLHPVNKRPVGERLARIALHQIHDQRALEWSGPVFQSHVRKKATIQVRFSHASGLKSSQAAVIGFEIAGADKVFQPADAQIDGTTVVVNSPKVTNPVAVRYAYTNAATGSLANAAGLPAAPFRTDGW